MTATDLAFPHPTRSRVLKVLHVGKFYPPHMGGMETHLETLCGGLRTSLDLRVIVASEGRERIDETVNGVAVSRLPARFHLASTPICPTMITSLHGSDADIVHLHVPNPLAVLAYLASGYRGRLVVTYHSDTVRQKVLGRAFEPILHAALRRADAIIATSPNYLGSSRVLALHKERCRVIPLGIRIEDFDRCDPDAVAEVRQQYGERLMISLGRLVYYKGFEHLIGAMPHVRGNLLIVGKGPLRDSLTQLAASLGVSDRVHFLGKIGHEQLVKCYHAAKVFVFPSIARSEAFGIAQVEAMAAGLPVVNTALDSGVPFVSLHEKTGLTVPPGDAAALAAAINRLLDNEPLRKSLGSAGRIRARQEFSVETMTARTMALYSAVMKQRPLSPKGDTN